MREHAETHKYARRGGGGDAKVRPVEWREHGAAIRAELESALGTTDELRAENESSERELKALGSVVVLEGADVSFPLRLDSLERRTKHRKTPKKPEWLLLSVSPKTEGTPERAQVWVSDEYRSRFMRLFEEYLEKETKKGNRQNSELVANIGRIRSAVVNDLWQSAGAPPTSGKHWWELWLRRSDDGVSLTRSYVALRSGKMAQRRLEFPDRTVVWVKATWNDLQALPFTSVPIAEIRRPEFAQTITDMDRGDQDELAADLAQRLHPADDELAPAVCHLDTGVRPSHVLLSGSLGSSDLYSIVGADVGDKQNHGTMMAGLALIGPLEAPLLSTSDLHLTHRLESVKFLPDSGPGHDPDVYGLVTAQAVALPEASKLRPRVFCMPITAPPDRAGEPSLWSASVDALSAGVDIGTSAGGIELLGAPDPEAGRLFVVAAGNIMDFEDDYLANCDLSPIEDPAQAWNALTVGAHTDLVELPADPTFEGWSAMAEAGDLSPHSRTSVNSSRKWPIKPDICMEGGNVLTDGAGGFDNSHPLLSLRTTDSRGDLAIGSVNATSAATAQAARLAAMAKARYPELWPESLRGLLVHAAEWSPAMRSEIDAAGNKTKQLSLLRRYGWGVPTEGAVLASTTNAVTMISQDEFVPFDGPKYKARRFRLHSLPWPIDALREIGGATAILKVTLSYFIEPTPGRRGWRRRYSYASHGLRFELKDPTEHVSDFLRRMDADAEREEEGQRPTTGSDRWVVGKNQRNTGSLHQDIWEGTGAALADAGMLAVHPVGGWWKNNKRKDRIDRGVRYSLIVSLRTSEEGVDLYTPIATQLDLPIDIELPGA